MKIGLKKLKKWRKCGKNLEKRLKFFEIFPVAINRKMKNETPKVQKVVKKVIFRVKKVKIGLKKLKIWRKCGKKLEKPLNFFEIFPVAINWKMKLWSRITAKSGESEIFVGWTKLPNGNPRPKVGWYQVSSKSLEPFLR